MTLLLNIGPNSRSDGVAYNSRSMAGIIVQITSILCASFNIRLENLFTIINVIIYLIVVKISVIVTKIEF